MRIELKPRAATGATSGVIFWDPDTGSIRCDNPVIRGDLHYLINRAKHLGCIHTYPHPNSIRAKDPTHSRIEFASLCAILWEVPEPLVPYYPQQNLH